MSVEHTSSLIVGFCVEACKLEERFKFIKPERSRLEDRYCHKTGKKLDQVSVTFERRQDAYMFNDEEYAHFDECAEAIAKRINCRITLHGNAFTGSDLEYSIQPMDMDELQLTFANVRDLEADCLRIKRLFEDIGVYLDDPRVFCLSSLT